MEVWLWVIVVIMALVTSALTVKIHLMQKSAKEIEEAFACRLTADTNTLIDISSRDKYMCSLASSVNVQLCLLRKERLRFEQGDTELKNAVTNISHDLRTPLTAIFGYLELLKKEGKSENAERYTEIIENRAEYLKQLTEELFRYSAVLADKNMQTENVVINDVLEESIAAFYAALKEKNITPNINITETKIVRSLDCQALSRVFSNLMNNAVKYSDGDLDITLSDMGEITFSNTANELNEVQVGKLFDRFYTVEAARKSTGLGLSIAKNLVMQMGGTIRAEYAENKLTIAISFE